MRVVLSLVVVGLVLSSAIQSGALAQGRPRATMFRDENFGGDRRVLDGAVPDFNSIGFNDRASSIQIDSGSWEFCEDANYRGRCVTLSRDDRNLAGSSLDDRFSSARPVADRNGNDRAADRGGPAVILYADVDFAGESRPVSADIADFRSIRFNDTISSIRVYSGTWQFCEDADFRGRCITAQRDMPTMVPSGFNDRISSMRRLR